MPSERTCLVAILRARVADRLSGLVEVVFDALCLTVGAELAQNLFGGRKIVKEAPRLRGLAPPPRVLTGFARFLRRIVELLP